MNSNHSWSYVGIIVNTLESGVSFSSRVCLQFTRATIQSVIHWSRFYFTSPMPYLSCNQKHQSQNGTSMHRLLPLKTAHLLHVLLTQWPTSQGRDTEPLITTLHASAPKNTQMTDYNKLGHVTVYLSQWVGKRNTECNSNNSLNTSSGIQVTYNSKKCTTLSALSWQYKKAYLTLR